MSDVRDSQPELPAHATTDEEILAALNPTGPTSEHARELFAGMNLRIADGEAATQQRGILVRLLHERFGWTQEEIAGAAEVSQQAVSRLLKVQDGLKPTDGPFLLGRLLGIAGHLVQVSGTRKVRCAGAVDKMMGGEPITTVNLTTLRGLLTQDLRSAPSAHREAFQEVTDLLGQAELPRMIGRHHTDLWWRILLGEARQKTALTKAARA